MANIESTPSSQIIDPVSPVSPVTAQFVPRRVKMHVVFDHELTNLRTTSPSTPLTFLGVCIGAALTLGIVLLTQKLTSSALATFLALFAVSALLLVFFAVLSIQKHYQLRDLVREIQGREVAPELPVI